MVCTPMARPLRFALRDALGKNGERPKQVWLGCRDLPKPIVKGVQIDALQRYARMVQG